MKFKKLAMLKVCCALIEHEGKVLVTQRSEQMRHPLQWEFPGGKLEEGEQPEDCVIREIQEELGITILPHNRLPSVIHHYPDIRIKLMPFVCTYQHGEIQLAEHAAYRWVKPENLLERDWVEADLPIVHYYLEQKKV